MSLKSNTEHSLTTNLLLPQQSLAEGLRVHTEGRSEGGRGHSLPHSSQADQELLQ